MSRRQLHHVKNSTSIVRRSQIVVAPLVAVLALPGGAVGDPPPPPGMDPGTPRAWQSGMQVATYSSVNLYNGNVQTVIPLVGWSGRGPDVSVGIAHNSADVNDWSSTYATHGPSGGFDLGPGWRHAYGGRVAGDPNDATVTVIEDDGTENLFTKDGSDYDPPAGVFDKLEPLGGGGWKISRKNQFTREFDGGGLLTTVSDAGQNSVTIGRDVNDRIDYVQDATGLEARRIVFAYYDDPNDPAYAQGRLKSISHTIVEEDPDRVRTWSFAYDPNDARLDKVTFPSNDPNDPITIQFAYDANGRLTGVTDKEGNTFAYSYHASGDNAGRLDTVTDPSPFTSQTQSFEYAWVEEGSPTEDRWLTTVTDRASEEWEYAFNTDGELARQTNPLDETRLYTVYDSQHNLIVMYTERGKEWAFQYDENGNQQVVYDPLGFDTVRLYDEYNNLTYLYDQAGNYTFYEYNDPEVDPNHPDPTQLLAVSPPDDGEGNPRWATVYEYWGMDEAAPEEKEYTSDAWTGLLKSVTTPNGVVISYEYDEYGQVAREVEGDSPNKSAPINAVTINSAGQTTETATGQKCGENNNYYICQWITHVEHDDEGNVINVSCNIGVLCPCDLVPLAPPTPTGCDLPAYMPDSFEDGGSVAQYDRMGRVKMAARDADGMFETSSTRQTSVEYDELGRVVSQTISSDEPVYWSDAAPNDIPTELVERTFTYDYSERWTEGKVYRTGPDGKLTTTTFDAAGRVTSVTIGADPNTVEQSAQYFYACCGLLSEVQYGNGTTTTYEYDDADRVTQILHEKGAARIKELNYTYVADGRPLIDEIEEFHHTSGKDITRYYYDDRSRLIKETRNFISGMFETPIYNYEYTYDQDGNRETFASLLEGVSHQYFYDVDEFDPNDLVPESHANRLLWYDVFQGANLVETVTYQYEHATGNPHAVIHMPKVDPNDVGVAKATYFRYNGAQQLRLLVKREWEVDHTGAPTDCNDVTQTLLREYRYDAPRQRYLEREWQPKDYPVTDWLQDVYGGKEYAGTSTVKLNWEDARTAAEAYDAHLATAEDSFEWYRLDGFWGLGGSVYLGGFQDPNSGAPEPLGGWTWITGQPFAPWCDPNNIGPGNPPWDYHEEEDPPPGGDPNEPQYYSDITVQPDDVPAGADYLKMNFASGQPFGEGNWYDSAGTGEEGYIIERPLFLRDEWRDYDGDSIYADWTVDLGKHHPTTGAFLPEVVPLRSHLAGVSFVDTSTPASSFTRYFHGDHLGTTRSMTDVNGVVTDTLFYSAFGVQVGHNGSTETRYGYVGAEGYQTDATTGFMHLGARYYDPVLGRFLQRDPIGIAGGEHVYLYATANPTIRVDSDGLEAHDTGTMRIWIRDAKASGMSHEEATRAWANANGAALFGLMGIWGVAVAPEAVVVGGSVWGTGRFSGCIPSGPPLVRCGDAFMVGGGWYRVGSLLGSGIRCLPK